MWKLFEILSGLIGRLASRFVGRRRVRVTVHKACFDDTEVWAYFINVTNLSKDREIVITHVSFECDPTVHAVPPKRPLPKRLKPDEPWETWIELDKLPKSVEKDPFRLGRVRLSTGKVVKSVENKNVPSHGMVPGGPTGYENE